MKLNKTLSVAILLFGLLAGGLGAGILVSQRPTEASAAPAGQSAVTCPDDDDVQHEAEGEADNDTEDAACAENDAEDAADTDNVQDEQENQADDGAEANETEEAGEVDEADEASALQDQATITADEAQAAAEAANPGAKTLAVEMDNENGTVIFEVELDTGTDVKVDAATGAILGSDLRDAN